MSAAHSPAKSTLLGNKGCLNVSRALSELQARRPIRIRASGESLLALPVDGLDEQRLADFAVLCSSNAPKLVVTQQRARSIGIRASTAMTLSLSRVVGVSTIFDLAANAENEEHFAGEAEAASRAARAAIRLAKLSRSLPAVLASDVLPNGDDDLMDLIATVEADEVNRFAADVTNTLALASEATIPLASGRAARFVVFRDAQTRTAQRQSTSARPSLRGSNVATGYRRTRKKAGSLSSVFTVRLNRSSPRNGGQVRLRW